MGVIWAGGAPPPPRGALSRPVECTQGRRPTKPVKSGIFVMGLVGFQSQFPEFFTQVLGHFGGPFSKSQFRSASAWVPKQVTPRGGGVVGWAVGGWHPTHPLGCRVATTKHSSDHRMRTNCGWYVGWYVYHPQLVCARTPRACAARVRRDGSAAAQTARQRPAATAMHITGFALSQSCGHAARGQRGCAAAAWTAVRRP